MGMTPADYWDGPCQLTRCYREADRLRKKRENEMAWLQGRYIYDAIGAMAPILQAFAKEGTKARPYVDMPYPMDKQELERQEEKRARKAMEEGIESMKRFQETFNQQFREKEGAQCPKP